MRRISPCGIVVMLLAAAATAADVPESIVKEFALNDLKELNSALDLEYDPAVSSDGKGSIKITTAGPVTVPLIAAGDLDIEDATLIYRAKVRCEKLTGSAFLEMWCVFAGKGDFFSRGLDSAVSGTADWTVIQARFYLKQGENPTDVRLNVSINGAGTLWIDQIELVSAPLPQQSSADI